MDTDNALYQLPMTHPESLFRDISSPRILITRLSAHGDVVQTLPLLNALKNQWPGGHIGWLVEEDAAPLLKDHPLIDRLHICQRKTWLKQLKTPSKWMETFSSAWQFQSEIRQEAYDVSLDVQGLLKSALWPWLCGIPSRFGNNEAREKADLFYNHKLLPHVIADPTTKAIEKYLLLPQAIGVPPELASLERATFTLPPIPQATWNKVEELLASLPKQRPVIAIAPATIWESKHWHEAHWYSLLQELSQWDVSVIILGSPKDTTLVERILPQQRPGNLYELTGKTTLPDLYALLQKADIFIGLDSAPLHIANAVNAQTGNGPQIIALFGPTAAGRTGPIGEGHHTMQTQLECQPCFERYCPLMTHDCMKQLSPNMVIELLKRMLAAQKLFKPLPIPN